MEQISETQHDETESIKRAALIVGTISSFLTPFMGSSVNVALPSIAAEFSMSGILLSWVQTSYLLATAIFLVPIGKIADIYGRKKIFTYGSIIYTISAFLIGLAQGPEQIIILRVIQGLGSSMIFSTGLAIVTSVFPPKERGKAIGIIIGAVYIGLAMGPSVGGVMTEHFGWRSIFFMNLPLGLIVIFSIFLKLKGEWAEAKGEKLDVLGAIIYGVSLAVLIYGLPKLNQSTGIYLVAGGFVGLTLFVIWEMKVKTPVFHINLFRKNITFALSNLAAFVNYSSTFAVTMLLSLYLQNVKGYDAQSAGFILIAQPVIMAIFAPLSGRFSDKIEARKIASVGMGLTTAGLVMLFFLTSDTSLTYILFSLVVLGTGFGLFSSPNTNAIMSSVDKKYYGIASSTSGTMRLTGQMFSMGVTMLILSLYIGDSEIVKEVFPEFMESVKILFMIFAVFCFGGIFASLARGNNKA